MSSVPKIKIEKLVGATNWAKWKCHMNMHFELFDMLSIIDGSRKCPNIMNTEDDQRNLLAWRQDNALTAVLITSALSKPVPDLVLTCRNTKDIWVKLFSVYEQSSIQRLSVLMTEFFKLRRDPEIDIAAYVAKVEKLFADMNTELQRRGSHDISIEALRAQILATVGPEYHEFSNVWESLDDKKRTTNICLRCCVRLKNGCRQRRRQSRTHLWHMG
jgi:hypothetical protein